MRSYRVLMGFVFLAFLESVLFAQPKNIILFIGDGMGFEQVKATRFFLGTPLIFESFPNQGQVTTYSANSSVTDSAAAATAISTGIKVNNGVISMAYPGNGAALQTLLEFFKLQGKETGLVTTVYLSHATPAAFGAHEPSRDNLSNIGADILTSSRPNVLLGGSDSSLDATDASGAGYHTVTTLEGFSTVVSNSSYGDYFAGMFGSGYMPYKYDYLPPAVYLYPTLSELTLAAIEALRDDTDGFFLMVEGGKIDEACHSNDLPRAIYEAMDFNQAVTAAINEFAGDLDTLILVTADHETGGLTVSSTPDAEDGFPSRTWTTTGHTGVNVPIYAWGKNSQLVSETMDNTQIRNVCTYVEVTVPPDPISNPSPVNASVNVPTDAVLSWTAGAGAASHDVYFGTSEASLTKMANQTATMYDPADLQYSTAYYWRIDEVNSMGTTAGPLLTFTTEPLPPPLTVTAGGETPSLGTVTGTYSDTQTSNNVYEVIREVVNPANKNGYSTLSHTWYFDLPSAVESILYVEAFHSPSSDNDHFIFAYSLDNVTYTNLLTVTKISDDDSAQSSPLPAGIQGRVYIRVTDSNHIKGMVALDELWVDSLSIICSNEPSTCQPVSMDYTVLTDKLAGTKGWSYGRATVTVTDNCGDLVEGALVSGHFTGDFNDSFTNVATNADGQAIFVTSAQLRRPTFGFIVDSVSHDTLNP